MKYDIKDLSAALFKNDYKERDNQPDYVGKVSHKKEPVYRIAAWLNESRNGKPYLSIKFSDFPDAQNQHQLPTDPFEGGDDVPF